ncbi:cyclase family protein [Halobellus rubicundus]|uniref:Cyclase family protein n=1 Tax=Halobellus rubicundus TaxID=2996466 RepID=A0ABD5MEV9_9EURY
MSRGPDAGSTEGDGVDRDIVDLTRPVESGMPTYPGDPEVRIEPHATHTDDGYRVSRIALGSHAGTHVDAPAHTEPDGATLGSFSLADLRFRARVVDCRGAGANEAIGAAALDPLPLDDVGAVVFRTGWSDAWGTGRMTDHPYLAPETARRCAEAGVAVAVDALSPDPTGGDGFDAHRALLGAGLPIVENVRDLGTLPDRAFELCVVPLAVDVDGAPARVFARV